LTAGNGVVLADATNCWASCTFDWSVDGADAGTTTDNGGADTLADVAGGLRSRPFAIFFTAHSQLTHNFTVGSHLVSVTVTDGLQRTITMELTVDVAAADLGKPPETDTLGSAGPPTGVLPPLTIATYLVLVGLLSLVVGLRGSRRGR
jgi:hypothetical protein